MKLNRLDAELCPFHFPSWVGPPQLCVCGPSGHSRSLSKELGKKKKKKIPIHWNLLADRVQYNCSPFNQGCDLKWCIKWRSAKVSRSETSQSEDKLVSAGLAHKELELWIKFLTFNPSHKQDNPRCDTVSSLYYSKWVHIVRTQNRDRLVCFSLPLPPALRLSGLRARVTLK